MLLLVIYKSMLMLDCAPCQTELIVVLTWPVAGVLVSTSASGLNIVRIF
jgi:hypothetical protein